MTFMSFDNHFETKVLFLVYFGSQIINEYYDDDLVEDCKKATSVHFYVAIKSSQNKDNRIATITCTHHVQLPSLQ